MSETSSSLNRSAPSQAEIPSDSKEALAAEPSYTVGYGRPPKHTQFQPGKSGNPKGRPKRDESLDDQRRNLYTQKVPVTVGNRKLMMPAIVAAEQELLKKALTGDPRAVQAALKIAKELGLTKEGGTQVPYFPDGKPMKFVKMTADELGFRPPPEPGILCYPNGNPVLYIELSEADIACA
jgi:hypothetical protein